MDAYAIAALYLLGCIASAGANTILDAIFRNTPKRYLNPVQKALWPAFGFALELPFKKLIVWAPIKLAYMWIGAVCFTRTVKTALNM